MRIIYFKGEGDFDAWGFEKSKPNLEELYEMALKCPNNKFEFCGTNDKEVFSGEVQAFDFTGTPMSFIDFIREEILDYDISKQSNFYVVGQDLLKTH